MIEQERTFGGERGRGAGATPLTASPLTQGGKSPKILSPRACATINIRTMNDQIMSARIKKFFSQIIINIVVALLVPSEFKKNILNFNFGINVLYIFFNFGIHFI